MPKRKRFSEPSLLEKLEKHCDEVFKAIKAAKGFERQRLSKRLREDGITPDKKERLDREVLVLKSLDLHQTARAHLFSSLLKVKDISASPALPEEIRAGVAKPALSAEEQAALHNVTSGLYSRQDVRQAVSRAVASVCAVLDVPVPGKGKRVRKDKRENKEEQPDEGASKVASEEAVAPVDKAENRPGAAAADVAGADEDEGHDESEWEGFSDVDDSNLPAEAESEADSDEERELSKYDDRLGSSSDEEDDDFDDARFAQFKGRETVNLDDISLSGSGSEPDIASDSESEPEDNAPSRTRAASLSPSPPPAKKKKQNAPAPAPGGSTFLPSLMGGYISGSESASDVDVAPAKKRLGQRQRQAIWEKKFGTGAKHLRSPATGAKKRDSGWDMRRGAVEGEDGGAATPWKKGIRNPLTRPHDGGGGGPREPARGAPRKKDDEGALHPSWEARKKAKAAATPAAFAGAKIVFD